jgi:DNase/tRNase domain of colicin-like bacteriocin
MVYQKINRSSSWNPPTQVKNAHLGSRSTYQIQNSHQPVPQQKTKHEASRFNYNFCNIPLLLPDQKVLASARSHDTLSPSELQAETKVSILQMKPFTPTLECKNKEEMVSSQSDVYHQKQSLGQVLQRMDDEDYEWGSENEEELAYEDKLDRETPAYEVNIPRKKHQYTTDGKTEYWTDKNGYVDFDKPTKGPPITKIATVNITSDISKIPGVRNQIYAGNQAKASRANHNTVANIIYENQAPSANGSNSPLGYTWHHHAGTIGRMDLLDRKEHAYIKHKGGHSVWGR